MKVRDIDFSENLLVEKSYKTWKYFNSWYFIQSFMGAKPVYIWFEKIKGFVKEVLYKKE